MNFFKDPLDELDTDFSDISDVKPSDLDKILKSAQDLDDEILAGGKDKTKDDKKSKKDERKSFDDPLADLGILSPAKQTGGTQRAPSLADKKAKKDAIASLFGLTEEPKNEDISKSPSSNILLEESKARPRSTGDWLGLSESPNRGAKSVINSAPPTQASRFNLTAQTQDQNRNRPDGDFLQKKTSIDQFGSSSWKGDQSFTKKKSNLLDDLFGSDRIRKEESKSDSTIDISGVGKSLNIVDTKREIEKTETKYTPSLNSGTKLDRKKADSSTFLSSTKIDEWNLLDDKHGMQQSSRQSTALRKQSPKIERKEATLPEWLGGTSAKSTTSNPTQFNTDLTQPSKDLPEGDSAGDQFDGGSLKSQQLHEVSKDDITHDDVKRVEPVKQVITTPSNTQENNDSVIGQLAQVQAQLGAAMSRHNQNLNAYMQVLMNEAERVAIGKQIMVIESDAPTVDSSQKRYVQFNDQTEKLNNIIEEKELKIKEQSDIMFDLETKLTKLELINIQLEMRIRNTEEIKDMELEKLKKGHQFDISNWENRLDRMKTYCEELVSDYETRINRLKVKEEEAEKEFQKRLETMEAERLSDLEKLGEFHRLVIEQSTMIGFSTSNFPAGIRLPLKLPIKPSDEVELTEREAALIDKERHIELLKATVEAEKRDVDQAKDREKIRREEGERELKRALMEIKLKEEFNAKDFERKMEQLKQQEQRLEEMRQEALKEQNEISKEKLLLAAEKARLEATISIQSDPNAPNLNPMDLMRARAEVDAALQTARDAREVADQERRRHVELRKAIEEISWEQKDKDQQLEMRERHLGHMIKEAECKREEGLKALEEAYNLKEELEEKQKEIKDTLNKLETREKVLAKERLEIAKERLELEKHKSQLELLLPELTPAEDLTLNLTSRSSSRSESSNNEIESRERFARLYRTSEADQRETLKQKRFISKSKESARGNEWELEIGTVNDSDLDQLLTLFLRNISARVLLLEKNKVELRKRINAELSV